MELRTRSRSKTPFLSKENLIEPDDNSQYTTVTRSTRRSTYKSTVAGGNIYSSEESYASQIKPSKTKSSKALSSSFTTAFTTSDYSSEEGDIESISHLNQNEKNKIVEDARAAANGTSEVSALNLYRKAGRYWDKYPKTDYTYSRHSRDRVEIAPGVVQMPNMSRRTIHSQDSSTNTDSYFEHASISDNLLNQRLFTSVNNNRDEVDASFKIHRFKSSKRTFTSIVSSVFIKIYTVIFWSFYSVYRTSNSTTVSLLKQIHHLASRVMLLDTWLLKKSVGGKRTKAVLSLCLLPLLLFGAWFLLSSLGSALYWSLFNPSQRQNTDTLVDPIVPKTTETINFDNVDNDDLVEKFLQNPTITNSINLQYENIKLEATAREQELLNLIDSLRNEINQIRDFTLSEHTKNAELGRLISQVRTENVRNIARLTQKINRCCNKNIIDVDVLLTNNIRDLLNDPEFLANQTGLISWLRSLFIAKQEVEERILNVTQGLVLDFDKSIEKTAEKVMVKVVGKLTDYKHDPSLITDDQIRKIVKSSLKLYDADKTGLVDYAMEPMGGQIITTRCTESYHAGTAVISVLGIPVWYPTISPRIVIRSGINPGECWAFQNFPGFLVIKLATRIRVDAFSYEHVSRLLVPEGKIDSAPKEFEVFGLESEEDKEPIKIGRYIYDYDGESIQYFTAHNSGVYTMIEIRITSNHGNPNYTCLYRFRVHGVPEPT